jgi:glutaredoxin
MARASPDSLSDGGEIVTSPPYELIFYTRTAGCPFVTVAKKVLGDYAVPYREIMIDRDEAARARVLAWTGFLSVPTIVVARPGDVLPITEPSFLEKGASPRGIDRGAMITEPSADALAAFLLKHGFISEIAAP